MQNKMIQQMMNYNKVALDNAFKVMMSIQEQSEKLLHIYMEQTTGLPEEWKRAITEWNGVYKKCCEDCHRSLEESFEKAQTIFTPKK